MRFERFKDVLAVAERAWAECRGSEDDKELAYMEIVNQAFRREWAADFEDPDDGKRKALDEALEFTPGLRAKCGAAAARDPEDTLVAVVTAAVRAYRDGVRPKLIEVFAIGNTPRRTARNTYSRPKRKKDG